MGAIQARGGLRRIDVQGDERLRRYGTDISCAMHMQGGLDRRGMPVKVRHIAEIVADGAA